jgi:hypothetical protein
MIGSKKDLKTIKLFTVIPIAKETLGSTLSKGKIQFLQ